MLRGGITFRRIRAGRSGPSCGRASPRRARCGAALVL